MFERFTLQADKLQQAYDDRLLFSDISFTIKSGQVLQIAGDNGTGKTTLLRMLADLIPECRENIYWNKESLALSGAVYRSSLLYVGHGSGLKKSLTVAQNLSWLLTMSCATVEKKRLNSVLQDLKLQNYQDCICYKLSAGQQRKLALARLALSGRPLWLLDEPFVSIDPKGIEILQRYIRLHIKQQGALIFTSHQAVDLGDIEVKKLTLSR